MQTLCVIFFFFEGAFPVREPGRTNTQITEQALMLHIAYYFSEETDGSTVPCLIIDPHPFKLDLSYIPPEYFYKPESVSS